jgi:hypothetical protein
MVPRKYKILRIACCYVEEVAGLSPILEKLALAQTTFFRAQPESLRGARKRTLAVLYETQKPDLSAYCERHIFIGMLDVYEWFERIAGHQIRHGKRMKAIAAELPKLVTSAENR